MPTLNITERYNPKERRNSTPVAYKKVELSGFDLFVSRLTYGMGGDLNESELLTICITIMLSPLALVGW